MIEVLYFEKEVRKAEFSKKSLDSLLRKKAKIWVDCTNANSDELSVLSDAFGLHPLTKEDLAKYHTRIKLEEFPEYLFMVMYGVLRKTKIELREFDLILGINFLISNHERRIDWLDKFKSDEKRVADLMKKGVDHLMHRLMDMEVDNYFPVLETLDDEIESLDENITKDADPKIMSELIHTKRSITKLKKVVFPQRDKISMLAKGSYRFISGELSPYFRDVHDHTIRVVDAVENYREMIGTSYEIYMSTISNRLNEVMKVLSIIATIMLPLTFITGLYGMNFDVLPGSHASRGFWIIVGFMVLLVVGMVGYFKKKGWF